ncbi:ABC transporter substrate-binding protein [Falsiroseomonas sp. E2-1-a4]|uniref:ABC transporter substrate-binding protein n=1 Tax=Falsiroseomonas sp. E2-1-a4 TaxID=3239299 RepID=UPI003F320C8C
MAMTLRLQEPFRTVFYVPFYAALARRAFEAEGLHVELLPGTSARGGGERVLAAVMPGAADVGWGGPIRVLIEHDRDAASPLRCFGAAVLADPFFIVGRTPQTDFKLADLAGLTLGVVSEVPTPWWMLAYDLKQAGVDPTAIRLVNGPGMAENAAALAAGRLDAVQLLEPFVTELVQGGDGHAWEAASSRGPTAYSTFYATAPRIAAKQDAIAALLRGMASTLAWVRQASPPELADTVGDYLPDLAPGVLLNVVARYKVGGIWPATPDITVEAFERLRAAMLHAGAITRPSTFEACVFTET